MKILILVNHYNTLRIFRRELLIELSNRGHKLVVSIPPCDKDNQDILISYGCRIIVTKEMERRGVNPIKDILLLKKYLKIIHNEKPDKVITYTIKPNVYGSIACKLKKIPCYVNITGLGSAFQAQGGMMRKLVSFLYKISINRAEKVFFENVGNRDTLVSEKIVKKEQTVVMLGAGVNLQEFYPCEYPSDKDGIRFLFVGRIMKEKGVDELFYAIRKLKETYMNIYFDFIGWYEDSYQSIIKEMQDVGLINFYGFQPEVRNYIEKCHCILLPSWHEGMSNTLLEGAAMCRPLITSNIHGCKEAIIDGETGYLVNVKDKQDLYDKMKTFINIPYDVKRTMGVLGRRHMETSFNKSVVVSDTIKELGLYIC